MGSLVKGASLLAILLLLYNSSAVRAQVPAPDGPPHPGESPADAAPEPPAEEMGWEAVEETVIDGADELPADELPADELPADELPVDELPVDVPKIEEVAPATPPMTPEEMRGLLLLLLDPTQSASRSDSLRRLAASGDVRLLPVLMAQADRGKIASRVLAVEALGHFSDPGVALYLAELAGRDSGHSEMRATAISALSDQGGELAGELLLELGRALSGELGEQARRLLRERYPATLLLQAAVEAGETEALLERPQDAELVQLLVQLGATSLPAGRAAAAEGLGRLQDPRAMRALEAVVASRDPNLAAAAVEALGALDVPLSSHILAKGVAETHLSSARRVRCLKQLVKQTNSAAAPLVFGLSWSHFHLFSKVLSEAELETYVEANLGPRMEGRFDRSRADFDVELIIDLLQVDSNLRILKALGRAREVNGRHDLLPALVLHLKNPALQQEAVVTLGKFDSDRARIALGRIVADVTEGGMFRQLALDHLARQPNPQAFKLLAQLYQGERSENSRKRILDAIRLHHAEAGRRAGLIVDEKERDGLIPMMIVGAIHAGTMMGLASDSIDPRERSNIVLPVVGGAILGAGGPLLLTLGDEVHPSEAAWVGTVGGWGLLDGALVAAMLGQDDNSEETRQRFREAGMAVGQLAGLVTAWMTRKDLGRDPGMVGYLNLSAAFGTGAGLGLGLLKEDPSSNLLAGLSLGGSLGATVAARYLAREVRFSPNDRLVISSTTGMSAWSVAWLARSMGVDHEDGIWGGILLGTGLGFAGGSVLGAYTEWDRNHTLYSDSAFLAGNLGGFGLAHLVDDPSTEKVGALMVGGGAAALAAAVLLADDLHFEGADRWTTTTATLVGGWSGAWLAESLGADHDTGPTGGLALGMALGYGVGSVLAASTDADPGFVGYVNMAHVMGNLGGLGLALQWEDIDAGFAGAWMVGGGATALSMSIALGQDFRYTDHNLYQSALLMGLGGWTGYYALHAARPGHGSSSGGGVLLGSAAGFAAGSVLAAYTDPEYGNLNRGVAGFGIGTSFGLGLGMVFTDMEDRWVESLMLAGGLAGTAGYLAIEDRTSYSGGDVGLLALGGAWGGWQGHAIWRAVGGTTGRAGTGARLLGSATGLIGTTAVSQWTDWKRERIAWAASGGAAGSILGGGFGLMVPDMSDELRWTLSIVGGWSGLVSELLIVPKAEFTSGDVAAMFAGTAWGIGQSWLIARAVDASETTRAGARMFGGSVGYLAGEAFGRAMNLDASAVLYTELAGYGAAAMGAGSVLLADGDDGAVAAVTSVAGWGAQVATSFFAEEMRFAPDDVWEYLLGQGFGTWQGLGYASYFDAGDKRRGGATLMGVSSGFLVPLVLNQVGDFTAWEDFLLTGGIVWGTWFGVWSPYSYGHTSFGTTGDPKLLGALIGGEVGLVATGLSLALGVSPETVGWTQLVGLMGMALGSSGTAIFSQDGPTVGTGMLVGTAAGLVTGAIWGEMRRTKAATVAADSGTSSTLARVSPGRRYSGQMPDWLRSIRPASLMAPPPAGHDDQPVLLFGVEGVL